MAPPLVYLPIMPLVSADAYTPVYSVIVLLRHLTVENSLEKFTFILRCSNLPSTKECCVFAPCLNVNSSLARCPTLGRRSNSYIINSHQHIGHKLLYPTHGSSSASGCRSLKYFKGLDLYLFTQIKPHREEKRTDGRWNLKG